MIHAGDERYARHMNDRAPSLLDPIAGRRAPRQSANGLQVADAPAHAVLLECPELPEHGD